MSSDIPPATPNPHSLLMSEQSTQEQTVNLDKIPVPEDWKGWLAYMALKILLSAAQDPWQFIYSVILLLLPLLIVSAFLARKLAKDIEHRETEKKNKQRREANIAKARRHAKND